MYSILCYIILCYVIVYNSVSYYSMVHEGERGSRLHGAGGERAGRAAGAQPTPSRSRAPCHYAPSPYVLIKIVPILRFVDSNFPGNSEIPYGLLMNMRIPPLTMKIMLEANPLKSRISVRRLAVPALDSETRVERGTDKARTIGRAERSEGKRIWPDSPQVSARMLEPRRAASVKRRGVLVLLVHGPMCVCACVLSCPYVCLCVWVYRGFRYADVCG